jgi:IS5 family transposase
MKMKIFEDIHIKYEQADWSRNPELGLLDTILEFHPELLKIVEADIRKGKKQSPYGRQYMPSVVEQIVRAAIYMEYK